MFRSFSVAFHAYDHEKNIKTLFLGLHEKTKIFNAINTQLYLRVHNFSLSPYII